MSTPMRPSPLSFDSGRQSPFKRQNSASPATVRATTPTAQSPVKPSNGSFSPTKPGGLSPEKTSPFVRRPSQISQTSERPASPFGRPNSSLSIPASPSRQGSHTSERRSDETPPGSPRVTPAPEVEEDAPPTPSMSPARPLPSPSPFDGAPSSPARSSPSFPFPTQANLRPAAQRTVTASSTTSTIKPPNFGNSATKPLNNKMPANNTLTSSSAYKNVPQPLLRSMRESFEVLDSSNSGSITSACVSSMLEQMGLDNTPAGLRDFFPPNAPSQLNLARYLETLSGPLSDLSPSEELLAAFSAFDVDDSGQIDVHELRKALLDTAPEPGEEMVRLSEREVDSILGEFAGRRAFGAKGMNAAKGKGEVFRYRDFMGSIVGGSADAGGGEAGMVS